MAKRFIQYFEKSFKENWDLPAMTNFETKQNFLYKDVVREIAKLHILFRQMNISQEDKIAIVGNNTPEWAIVFLATLTYGAVAVPILQKYHIDDIINVIEHSESKVLFVDDERWRNLQEKKIFNLRSIFALEDFQCVQQSDGESLHVIMKEIPTLYREIYPNGVTKDNIQYCEKNDSALSVINYTSGTTGFSKGVMLSADNFLAILENINYYNLASVKDEFLVLLPFSHMYGCFFDLILPMSSGAHVTILPQFPDSKSMLKIVSEVKPDNIIIVPAVLEAIYKNYFRPSLKQGKLKLIRKIPFLSSYIYSKFKREFMKIMGGGYKNIFLGGANLDREVEDFLLKARIPFKVGYGMTECTASITLTCPYYTPHSVGTKVRGTDIAIDSKDPQRIAGEILVKGRNVMLGYYRDEEATSRVFTRNGWFKTGDLGVIDKKGNLYVKGRCKNIILTSSGQNIYPEEIESKINELPFVCENIVLQRKEKIVALIRLNEPKIKDLKIDDIDLFLMEQRKSLNKRLATYEYISDFIIQEVDFEKTSKGEIKRYLYE